MMNRKQIAAANWKMNLTLGEARQLTDELLKNEYALSEQRQVILGVPFPYLEAIAQKTAGKEFFSVAAQNCSHKKSGAYTGETSVDMLMSVGVSSVIIGHSERREYYAEDNALLREKVDICLGAGLQPIFCCGESLPIRESGEQNAWVEKQLRESLFHLSVDQIKKIVIAYEPIWAIGTGKTATSEQAQDMHAHIRQVLTAQYGDETAASISILYGGSVKASNASELFAMPDVDGGLVGGASLVAAEFATIINSLKK